MIKVDLENELVSVEDDKGNHTYNLSSPEAFALISQLWLRAGWDNKYVYGFSWLGRPIIQLPEDIIRLQEVIFSVQPDVIIETGIAHGGSLIFSASLCKATGRGRVIGVDVEIRPHNRRAVEEHPLASYITMIEGDSVAPEVVSEVKSLVKSDDRVLVVLDSCHSKAHVLAELKAYAPLVSVGSYIVATDGIMEEVVGAPRTNSDWSWNNPKQAALEFIQNNQDFAIEEPKLLFNESLLSEKNKLTYFPSGYIKRLR